ncbi:MAG: MFS transporter [Alphaproteobacteria bacterium]|nr:MFS transporter [Alphaproteobacteria bacterium]
MTDAASSWSELFERRNATALVTLSLGVALHAFNGFLVATALPTAVIEIGGVQLLSWAFTVYLVFAIIGGAGAARLKQMAGGRQAMIVSALVFLAGTLIAGMAPSMPVLLAGRALQGVGEGVISALCYILIPELFPSRLIARVFGVEAMVWALGAFGGPLISGVLTEALSWRMAFFVNVPVVALFLILVVRVVPPDASVPEAKAKAVPLGRLAGCAIGIMMVAVAAISGDVGAASLLILSALAILVGVFVADRRRPDRLFPSDAFAFTTTVGAGLWMILLMPIAHASSSVYLNITIQHLWGYGPTVAGFVHAMMALSWSGSALIFAGIDDPGRRLVLIRLGPVLIVAGLLGTVLAIAYDMPRALLPCQIVIGTGFGGNWAFLSQAIMEAARPGERDAATTMLQVVLSSGFALGSAIAGLVANLAGFAPTAGAEAIVGPIALALAVGAGLGTFGILAGFGVRLPRPAPSR